MAETFEEYRNDELNNIHIEAEKSGETPDAFFFENALSKLQDMGEITDPQIFDIYKKCRNNKIMAFDAYGFDEADKSIVLIAKDYADNTDSKLTKTDIEKYKNQMLNFLEECHDNKLSKYLDEYDDMNQIGYSIGNRLRIDYVSSGEDQSIDKIKLYIVSDKVLSNRVNSTDEKEFLGKHVELNVWGIERFYDLYKSGHTKEPILIDTNNFNLKEGIPCIKAEMSSNTNYDAYLAIVPGQFLNDIYLKYGSRLLEGNIRAFLSTRGKINKGIRETIKNDPTKFFTYNNGIACTASDIKLSNDGHYITELTDLQIINGGQTTASLSSAYLKDKLSLDNIFVPMKVTVVKASEDYDGMIQNIAKFANSQNKVTDADLFSNHPFHRAFEDLSKKILCPAKPGSLYGTYWYYERSRGKYEQELFKLQKKSERDNFFKKYPKDQVIKKEELAKYFNTVNRLEPYIVSRGSQKNMADFAKFIDDQYQKSSTFINENFYHMCIAYAIIYRETDNIVSHAQWYNVGGYKLNIVPYTISKLISLIPKGFNLDFNLIWKKQEMYPSLKDQIEKIAPQTNKFITNSSGVIVTEYCKKQETWEKFKEVKIDLTDEFKNDLINETILEEQARASKKDEKNNKDINIMNEIFNLGSSYWSNLKAEGLKRHELSDKDISLLGLVIKAFLPNATRFPSDKQCKLIWEIRKRLGDLGVLI